MHETLSLLVARAVEGSPRPLVFYLREHSHLPGPRANLSLVDDVAHLLIALVREEPERVRTLLNYLLRNDSNADVSNTPTEFVILCGIVGLGECATVQPGWRRETFDLLAKYATNASWRLREGVAMAFQRLLAAASYETLDYLTHLAKQGNYFQQRAAIAGIAEPVLLHSTEIINAALNMQRIVLERIHAAPSTDRKREDFGVLRQALGYTLSVVTAATPTKGFALMEECATWNDPDINWILRENLKKKRLAKFVERMESLSRLLVS